MFNINPQSTQQASSSYCPMVPPFIPRSDTMSCQIAAVERRQDDLRFCLERHFAETNQRIIHSLNRLHDGQNSLVNQIVSIEANMKNAVGKTIAETVNLLKQQERAEVAEKQLQHTVNENDAEMEELKCQYEKLKDESSTLREETQEQLKKLSSEKEGLTSTLMQHKETMEKQATDQLNTLLKERQATKKQLAEFTVEIEKLKDENRNLREKTQEQLIKLQSEKEDFTSTLIQNKETLEKQTKELQLAKADLTKLQSENNAIKDNLFTEKERAEVAEKQLQHTVNQKDELSLEIVNLKSENENLKNPQDWSLNFWRNKVHENHSRRQRNYTICVAYSSALSPFTPALFHTTFLLNGELEPVTRNGGAKFKFVYHTIDGCVANSQKQWDAVIVVNKVTSNRLGVADRQVYGLLNAHYNGRVDRRHMVLLSAAYPTIENIVPFDDIDKRNGISKDQLITQNMSTLFISNKEKNLVSCEFNKVMIKEITKWIMDVITSP